MFKKVMTYVVLLCVLCIAIVLSIHFSLLDGASNGVLYMGIVGALFFYISRYLLPLSV